jgi:DNA-binding transcriptional ArsR family regulator
MRQNFDPKGLTPKNPVIEQDAIETRIQFFQQIADPVRHSILDLLSKENEISVTDILSKLKKPQTLISYHLRCLKELGLVVGKKADDDGRKTLYSLHASKDVQNIFSLAENYIKNHGNCGSNPCNLE